MEEQSKNLGRAFFICLLAYIIALMMAVALWYFVKDKTQIFIIASTDFMATVVVFIFSVIFKNSSIYDPYWSVTPVFIVGYLILNPVSEKIDLTRQIIVTTLVSIWAIRLTYNWIRQWKGLNHEDWRYEDLKVKCGKMYWPVSFLGIHLFPTILVFLGCLSLFPALSSGNKSINILDIVGIIITLSAIIIEATSDEQLRRFHKKNKNSNQVFNKGLWSLSRHPNYFGEVSFWWGLFFFGLAAKPEYWWTVIGPISITFLFLFISIPMMDKKMLKENSNYSEYKRKTSAFIPWFHK